MLQPFQTPIQLWARNRTARFAKARYWVRSCRNPRRLWGSGVLESIVTGHLVAGERGGGKERRERREVKLISTPSSLRRGLIPACASHLTPLTVYFLPHDPWLFPHSPIFTPSTEWHPRNAGVDGGVSLYSLLNSGYEATICTNC